MTRSLFEAIQAELGGAVQVEEPIDVDALVELLRHARVLQALVSGPQHRKELQAALDVSRATSHRLTRRLEELDLVTRGQHGYRLTGEGEAVVEEVLRFQRNVRAAGRLAPLLSAICEHHREFVIEPFADATVTTAEPGDPYRPVRRFLSLVQETERLHGFNAAPMAPLDIDEFHRQVFDETDTELIYLPGTIETLLDAYPERASAALERGHLTLLSREALPYGLVLSDDRVGIGGYDEETGMMTVFVDTDTPAARRWAERVYGTYRADADPIDEAVAFVDRE